MDNKFRKVTSDKTLTGVQDSRTVEAGIMNLAKYINLSELGSWFSRALEGVGLRKSLGDIASLAGGGAATKGGEQFVNKVMTGAGKEMGSLQTILQGLMGKKGAPLPEVFDEMGKVIKPGNSYSIRSPLRAITDFISNTAHGFSPKQYKELLDKTVEIEVMKPNAAGLMVSTPENFKLGAILKDKSLFDKVDWDKPINKGVLDNMAKYNMDRMNSKMLSNGLNWGAKGYMGYKGYQAYNGIFHPPGDTDAGLELESVPGGDNGGWPFPGGEPGPLSGEENGRPLGTTPATEDWEPLNDYSRFTPDFMPTAESSKFRKVTAQEVPQAQQGQFDSSTVLNNLTKMQSALPSPEDMQKIIESALSLQNPAEVEQFLATNLFRPYGQAIDVANNLADASQQQAQQTQHPPQQEPQQTEGGQYE